MLCRSSCGWARRRRAGLLTAEESHPETPRPWPRARNGQLQRRLTSKETSTTTSSLVNPFARTRGGDGPRVAAITHDDLILTLHSHETIVQT